MEEKTELPVKNGKVHAMTVINYQQKIENRKSRRGERAKKFKNHSKIIKGTHQVFWM